MSRRTKTTDIRAKLKEWADEFHKWSLSFYGKADAGKVAIGFKVRISQSDPEYRALVEEGVTLWRNKYDKPVRTPRRRRRAVDTPEPRRRRRR